MKTAALIIQKYWQGYAQRQRYQRMRVGYMRLQALIRSRVLSHRFRHLRGHIVGLQVSQGLFNVLVVTVEDSTLTVYKLQILSCIQKCTSIFACKALRHYQTTEGLWSQHYYSEFVDYWPFIMVVKIKFRKLFDSSVMLYLRPFIWTLFFILVFS